VDDLFPVTKEQYELAPPSADLVARIRFFLSQKDPSSVDKAMHLAWFVQQDGEAALNAKLFQRFGDGLPFRVPGQKGPARKEEAPVPKTLRELIRAFLKENDPGYLAIEGESAINEMLAQAAEYGMDSLEADLCRRYGVGLNGKRSSARVFINPGMDSEPASSFSRDGSSFDQMAKAAAPADSDSPSPLSPLMSAVKQPLNYGKTNPSGPPPTMARAKSEKPQTFVEVSQEEEDDSRTSTKPPTSPMNGVGQAKPMKRHDFFDDKSLRADLKAFYSKHDKKKLEPQKFEPIVQWAYKIGPSELNRRFEEKYGESLNQFLEDMHAGRPGVAPGPKNVPAKTVDDAPRETGSTPVCSNYKEAKPGKSFGVCTCGYSRVDHRNIKSLLVPGPEEPHFNKAKPKIVISKNPSPPNSTSKPSVSAVAKPSAGVTASSSAPPAPVSQQPSKLPPKVVAPAPAKFEVKVEGKDGPCSDYRLDLEGRSFGVCKCGWSRAEHYKAKQQVAWATHES